LPFWHNRFGPTDLSVRLHDYSSLKLDNIRPYCNFRISPLHSDNPRFYSPLMSVIDLL